MSSRRIRTLVDLETDATWTSEVTGSEVLVRTTGKRSRESTKSFPDTEAAVRWAVGEEWKQLKKGLILVAPEVGPGEPQLHRFMGREYTGALAAAEVDGQFLTNVYEGSADALVRVAADGAVASSVSLPGLLWQVRPLADSVVVRVDHGIWTVTGDDVLPFSTIGAAVAAVLATAGDRVVVYQEPDLVVFDAGAEALRVPATPQTYGGHTPVLAAALSGEGDRLVYSTTPGELVQVSVPAGVELARLDPGPGEPEFQIAKQLSYAGEVVLVVEMYGRNTVHAFDADTLTRRDWAELGDLRSFSLAVSPDATRVAVAAGSWLLILDAKTGSELATIPLEHVVKGSSVAWDSDHRLTVRTDYGCLSVYRV